MTEPKKRGRKPKSDFPTNDTGAVPENKRLTEWERRVMTALVENAYEISPEDFKGTLDEFAKKIGTIVLESMTAKDSKNWVRRTDQDVQDFFIRFTRRKS
jgi:hypothetical protein